MVTKISSETKVCSRCVMDTTAEGITFDDLDVCNFCKDYENKMDYLKALRERNRLNISELVESIKRDGSKAQYDCIVGVSGGVDSSWVLVKAVELGLRPLAVHLDNGWNSELAQKNIENLVTKLGIDLYTKFLDWKEFRDLQESFFQADVLDIEILTDNFLVELNFKQARKYNCKYILSGSNTATEGIPMPANWAASSKYNESAIKNIWEQKGKGYKLKSISILSLHQYYWNVHFRGVSWIRFLDYLNYEKANALNHLQNEYGYVPYIYKHYESVFTRLYQGIILPQKFNVDKRKNHLSALIMSGEITREQAMLQLREIPFESESAMQTDQDFFLKKFRWSRSQFEQYLRRPEIALETYGNDIDLLKHLRPIKKVLRSIIGK